MTGSIKLANLSDKQIRKVMLNTIYTAIGNVTFLGADLRDLCITHPGVWYAHMGLAETYDVVTRNNFVQKMLDY